MTELRLPFDPADFLATVGLGRRVVEIAAGDTLYCQGDASDATFYLQKGRVKVTILSEAGKEATITMLHPRDFAGEDSMIAMPGLRLATATAIIPTTALKIERSEMARVMSEEHAFSNLFLAYLLSRAMRTQADLVDHLFNSSEKRLARVLLLMADFGKPDATETLLPPITQETLAAMVGTTRSRVSFFMNRFRKLGFIDYNERIRVRKSLLNVVLHDLPRGENTEMPELIVPEVASS